MSSRACRVLQGTPYRGWATHQVSTGLAILLLGAVGCQSVSRPQLPPGTPALHRAAAEDRVAELQKLLHQDPDPRGPFGWTPLHFAAVFGGAHTAEVLLDRGAHVDALDRVGMTPLHWAARRGHLQLVELLLARKAEVMARNIFDMTPLHEARTVAIAERLLARGAELQAQDLDGMTPLHTAATREVAQFLIKRGADLNARAKDGRTPMDMPPAPAPRIR